MNLKNNHALEYFFKPVLLAAHCNAMPDRILVCYKVTDEGTMNHAMENINAQYGQHIAVQENMTKMPGFVGFWLPEIATPLYLNSGEEPEAQPTPASIYLKEMARHQKIVAIETNDFIDLHKKLPEALFSAALKNTMLGSSFPSSN